MDFVPLSTGESTSGWTGFPNTRGTSDIIISCVFTIILCCWTSVCPNLPAVTDSKWARLRDKFDLTCIGLLGPEILFGLSLGQLASARRSVKKFEKEGFSQWTLTHAFFSNMGGFVLQAPDLTKPIPLDAEQLYNLIIKKHIDYPALSKGDIDDKNKVDGLARLLSIGQALWFLASFIARPIQGLGVTTLELTTVSFVIVFFGTSFCWRCKPSGVTRPVILGCKTSIAQIRSELGLLNPDEYRRTPLDPLQEEDFVIGMIWRDYVHLLQRLRIPIFSRPITSRPHDRIRGDDFHRTELVYEVLGGILILAFCSLFLCAWNIYFPTAIERLIWRFSSVFMFVFGVFGGVHTWIWHYRFYNLYRDSRLPVTAINTTSPRQQGIISRGIRRRAEQFASKLRMAPPDENPNVYLPLRLMVPTTVLCAVYCLCRGYIFVEDVIGLRSLPSSAYITVNWAQYIPHI